MDYKESKRNVAVCLECGDRINYGRTDKKFCCHDCRQKYNNQQVKSGRAYRRRMMAALARNYSILDGLLKSGVKSVDIVDVVSMGFVPGVVTSYHKIRRHDEYSCFDIKYIMTSSRICSITKISLNLSSGEDVKSKQ
jgi:hypothetical protein